jgi:nicotinamide riboside kinase
MAKGHLDSLEKEKATLQFVDTDFIVFKVWSEYRFSHASSKIHQLISEDWFNLHVLCAPDIPWESDPLRENPNDRDQLFETYVETLERYRKPYLIVEGSHDKRMKKVQQALRQIQINP